MPRLVVLADSLCFHGPQGPLPVADRRVYPNLLADGLAAGTGGRWEAVVVARAGWSVRELWFALQRDVHLQQQLLIGADAVVMGVGSADGLSMGVPRPLLAALPFLRPTSLRRSVRRLLDRHHGTMVRLTGARIRHTPLGVYRHCWGKYRGRAGALRSRRGALRRPPRPARRALLRRAGAVPRPDHGPHRRAGRGGREAHRGA